MKKITSIFILVSSISICFNQDIKEEILSRYKNGTKKEVLKVFDNANFKVKLERIIYSNHGYPIFVESFFDDRIVERDYFNNGKLKKEINYKNKMLNGEILEYFDNDQLKCSFIYDKGEIKPGKYNSYYINGFIKDTFSFGDIIEYHDNGKLKFKAFAIDTITYDHSIKYSEFLKSFIDTTTLGIKYKGDYKKYYKNGKLKLFIENINWNSDNSINMDNVRVLNNRGNLIYNFKIYRNLYHDEYLSYFNSGKIKTKGQYELGNKIGLWIEYDENGNILLEEEWKDGERL